MKIYSFFTLLMLTVSTYSIAVEEATIKLNSNVPVAYHSTMKLTVQQKTDAGLKNLGKGSGDFSLIANVNSDKKPYELLITPKKFNFDFNMGGLTVSYDTELALKTNSIAQEKDFLQTILDHTFHIPLTNDENVGDPTDFYTLNIFNNPENKLGHDKYLKEIVDAIDSGIKYTAGQKEEFDLDANDVWDQGHVVRTVTKVDSNKVVVKEEITMTSNSFVNGENPEEGGYVTNAKGVFEKTIQRSNWLLMSCDGNMVVQISEMAGPNGKQTLADGDLIINIQGTTTSALPNADTKLITTPVVQK